MADVKWIKLTTSMFDDEKIKLIESMPDRDAILIIWIKLIIQAGKSNASGYICLNDTIPFSDEMLATIFNRPLNTIRLAIETFRKFGMIEITDNGGIYLTNFEKHQNIEGLEKIREQTRLRVARYREKLRTVALPVTQSNATDIDLDIDLELDLEKEVTPNERQILNILKSIPLYPINYAEDLDFIRTLAIDYPGIDLLSQVQKWRDYKRDKPLTAKSSPRLQFRNWCKNAAKWAAEKEARNGSPGHTRQYNPENDYDSITEG